MNTSSTDKGKTSLESRSFSASSSWKLKSVHANPMVEGS